MSGRFAIRSTDVADRVVTVLDLLGDDRDGLTVGEIARRLDVHPSTASRLLGTIAAGGLIEREATTQRYRIGARVVGLAAAAVDRLPVVSQARPQLEHLSLVTSETANLAIATASRRVCGSGDAGADRRDGELGRQAQPSTSSSGRSWSRTAIPRCKAVARAPRRVAS
jgi:DNA-binding IclR family transcriptional regulator